MINLLSWENSINFVIFVIFCVVQSYLENIQPIEWFFKHFINDLFSKILCQLSYYRKYLSNEVNFENISSLELFQNASWIEWFFLEILHRLSDFRKYFGISKIFWLSSDFRKYFAKEWFSKIYRQFSKWFHVFVVFENISTVEWILKYFKNWVIFENISPKSDFRKYREMFRNDFMITWLSKIFKSLEWFSKLFRHFRRVFRKYFVS